MLYRLFSCAVLIICMIFDDSFISVVGMRGLWTVRAFLYMAVFLLA